MGYLTKHLGKSEWLVFWLILVFNAWQTTKTSEKKRRNFFFLLSFFELLHRIHWLMIHLAFAAQSSDPGKLEQTFECAVITMPTKRDYSTWLAPPACDHLWQVVTNCDKQSYSWKEICCDCQFKTYGETAVFLWQTGLRDGGKTFVVR